ncbi:hypothetical protein ACQFN5_28715 (plasmid) [Klebsiella sp. WOUb02]|uniref:hypothetical protein n=1 Tax=Klebsiella sp. WOUb02 TaxID=3161071 RepID=UPI003CF3272B
MSPYLHQTPNRIRIRSEYIQRNPDGVADTIAQLRQLAGVEEITHRLYAGSVTIIFDSKILTGNQLLAHIEPECWLSVARNKTYIDQSIHRYTRSLAKGLALMTLNVAIKGPLIRQLTTFMR